MTLQVRDDDAAPGRAVPGFREPIFQQTRVSLSIGKVADVTAETKLTSGGLLAVGALVSAILLSTAVLVRSAVRDGERRP